VRRKIPFNTQIPLSPRGKTSVYVYKIRHTIPIDNVYYSSLDPFADAAKGDDDGVQDGLVHVRIQQRNGRKTLTTIQGLSAEYDLKKIVRACKKVRENYKVIKGRSILLELTLLWRNVTRGGLFQRSIFIA